MSKQNLVSLELAKLIKEWGWDGECEYYWARTEYTAAFILFPSSEIEKVNPDYIYEEYAAPHILDDLCIKYKEEMFGGENMADYYRKLYPNMKFNFDEIEGIVSRKVYLEHGEEIFKLLQQGKKDEAEEYFINHTILNQANK